MKILAIESSCDETSASVLEDVNGKISVLSNVTATSLNIHATTGGIIPENAARMQVKYIMPVIYEALCEAGDAERGTPTERAQVKQSETSTSGGGVERQDPQKIKLAHEILRTSIDAIAVTYGPGLIGSLLVGVETAKTLSYTFNKPLIPVNHLLAHIYANFISNPTTYNLQPTIFPFIGLIVSGGHTDLLLFRKHGAFQWLGGTRDDAAGEALDKIGRLLNLPYPAGPEIERRADLISNPSIKFKSPIMHEDNFDFSFSGLKTEVMRFIKEKGQANVDESDSKVVKKQNETTDIPNRRLSHSEEEKAKRIHSAPSERHFQTFSESFTNTVCYATQKAIIDVLVKKTLKAAEKFDCKTILVGGGVSANQIFRDQFKLSILNSQFSISLFAPQKEYCTDNAAMIGAYALKNYKTVDWRKVNANPELYFA